MVRYALFATVGGRNMGVSIKVIGGNTESDEYISGVKLKEEILKSLPVGTTGEVVIYASATLLGQEVKDVDIVLIGNLDNYSVKADFTDKDNNLVHKNVDVRSFCTTIEVKSHGIQGIVRSGTDYYVRYGNSLHCVTEQSNKQKISLMNFFKRSLSYSPYITNLIWFTQITEEDSKVLCSVDGKEIPNNILSSSINFKHIVQLIALQQRPFYYRGKYRIDAIASNTSINSLSQALNLFGDTKVIQGELTRKRVEQLTINPLNTELHVYHQEKVLIYRGRAGTGKTIGLIQVAIKLVETEEVRVLMLTYNKALVADIRRLFAFAELPDIFNQNCIAINTMQAYFYRLINNVLYESDLDGKAFLGDYFDYLKELLAFLDTDEMIRYVKEICNKDIQLNWNYILIDEAQDWTKVEKDLVLKLFDKDKVIVADGGQQFVRNVHVCDWSMIEDRVNIKLKKCLRQKNNLINFINHYINKMGVTGSKIIPSKKMVGGKIIVICDKNELYDIHRKEMDRLIEAGNIPYDMMYLVPHTMVEKFGDSRAFRYKDQFENKGISLWDGTNINNRSEYSISTEEIRLFQYDSARGLEGWTVVCLDFDVYLNEKEKYFPMEADNNSLILETTEARLQRYMLNWMLIPLTRAIDTLVITLNDKESDVGLLLKEVANENSDYITWIE